MDVGKPRLGTQRIKSVQLKEDELVHLLNRLDSHDVEDPARAGRQEDRFNYRLKEVVVTLYQPGGTVQSFLVPTRDVSATGISFLHGGYVHNGTRCMVQLITPQSTCQGVEGVAVRCRHIEGRIHEIGIRFDHRIDMTAFVSASIRRRVLLADDDPSIRRLLSFYLSNLNAEVSAVESGHAVLEAASQAMFDLILLDLDMPELNGVETLRALRKEGYAGRVIAITSCTGSRERERCLAVGFDDFREKPVSRQSLLELLAAIQEKPLYSSLADQPGMDELIGEFVSDLVSKTRAIASSFSQRDLATLQRLARSLKGEAGSYGFEPIAEVAKKVEEISDPSAPIDRLEKRVKELLALCNSARAAAHHERAAS